MNGPMALRNLGLASGFSSIYSPNAAPDTGFVMVSLKPRHRVPTSEYVNRVRAALDEARRQGLAVVPLCPYVAGWIRRHPEYAELLTPEAAGDG